MLAIVYIMMFSILIFTSFDFKDIVYLAMADIAICVCFSIMLVPFFQIVVNTIIEEPMEEQKWAFQREDQYKKMFDCL